MKCNHIERLLHFKREELSQRRARKVARHIESCRRCAEVKGSMKRTSEFIGQLREIQPQHPTPELSVNEIVTAVRMMERTKKWGASRRISTLDRLFAPRVKLAAAGLALLLVAAFLSQELYIMYRISFLEQKVAASVPYHKGRAQYRATGKTLYDEFEKMDDAAIEAELRSLKINTSDEWILISRDELLSLLSSHTALQRSNRLLLKRIETLSAEIGDVSFVDGINRDELDALLARKELLVEAFRRL